MRGNISLEEGGWNFISPINYLERSAGLNNINLESLLIHQVCLLQNHKTLNFQDDFLGIYVVQLNFPRNTIPCDRLYRIKQKKIVWKSG